MAKPSVPGSLRSVVLRCVPVLMLASASPARHRLLEQAGVPHRVRVSGVDEDQIQHSDPAVLVNLLAQAKAMAVAQTLDPVGDAEITAVLGCDSVLSFEGQVFGKPSGPTEAIERWQRMAGGCGSLLTGHCLIRRGHPEVLTCVKRWCALPRSARPRSRRMWPVENRCNVPVALPWRGAAAFALKAWMVVIRM